MVMTSGASLAATWVASLSKYPPMSPYSGLTLMFGLACSNSAMALLVRSARPALPHQENRISTGPSSGLLDGVLEHAAVRPRSATAVRMAVDLRRVRITFRVIGQASSEMGKRFRETYQRP